MAIDHELKKQADKLYEQYGKPLEPEHLGEYVAISSHGQTIIGQNPLDVAQRARAAFGPGSFLFRIGTKAVGKWR